MKVHIYKAKNSANKPAYIYDDLHLKYGEIVRNFMGGWCFKNNYEIMEDLGEHDKDEFEEIHRKEIYAWVIKEDSPYGWLSPSCEWLPCGFRDHEAVAFYYLGEDETDLEDRGWLKIFRNYPGEDPCCYSNRITALQQEWCENHGVKVL